VAAELPYPLSQFLMWRERALASSHLGPSGGLRRKSLSDV
jgi:hypothetical protein